jgi:hypothetical protein
MREDDFMGEQRGPFKSSGSVCIWTTDQFMLAIGKFDELGLTELTDEFGAIACWNQIFQFHTPQL